MSQLVQSALDGYKVCLFSYGQTGSGKTHTMQGAGSEGGDRGLIPRCIEQIGRAKVAMEDKGWVYKMEVTFIEIYNEEIRDLLRGVSGKAKGGEGGEDTTMYQLCISYHGHAHARAFCLPEYMHTYKDKHIVHARTCIQTYTRTNIYMYVSVCVCMCMCMRVCMYACMT